MKTITKGESKVFDFSFVTLIISLLLVAFLMLCFSIDKLTTKDYLVSLNYFGVAKTMYSFTVPKLSIWLLPVFVTLFVFATMTIKTNWREIKKDYLLIMISCFIGMFIFYIIKLVCQYCETDLSFETNTILLFVMLFSTFLGKDFINSFIVVCFSSFFTMTALASLIVKNSNSFIQATFIILICTLLSLLINLMIYSVIPFLVILVKKLAYVGKISLELTPHEKYECTSED